MTLRTRYQADLAKGFHVDAAQQEAVEVLQTLYDKLVAPPGPTSFLQRLFGGEPETIRGLYLWGGPGRGKTYLMDCFFASLPIAKKRRVHFHRFMLEIHHTLGQLPKTPDPLPVVAERLAQTTRVLCLDEFHVTDIADAMLLSGLLEALFERRVTLVATSNTAPEALYSDGLQRDRFVPAIELLQRYNDVFALSGKRDFRMALLQHSGTYQVGGGEAARQWLHAHLGELASLSPCRAARISIHGRELEAVALADDIVWFDFAELCIKPRSARDYLELAREFHTLLLEGVPCFGEETDEAARRFIHLVDALYDHGVKLVVTAAAQPCDLYHGRTLEKHFQRTASRLTEMASTSYLARPHRPD
jgi:cell division protein ZapE